ncbi:MAG: hypothetical protein NZ604_06575 [Flavobacteriales bacterium]|nr:hypothetical protein [Flavobacteriales bacterium]
MRTIAILSILLITSCATIKKNRYDRKCAKFDCIKNSYVLDSTFVTEIKDTTYITKQGTTVYLENPCAELCDEFGQLKPFEKVTVKDGIKNTIKSVGNVIVSECDLDSMKQVNTTLREEIFRLESQTIEVPRKKTWFEKLQSIWFYISATAIILYLALKIKRVF